MKRGSLGFTLIELVISLVLTAILLALGVPAMRDLIQNNRQATGVNGILVSLNLARAEAVRRGTPTVVCISDGTAPPDCDGSSVAWEGGWIIFVDGDGDGALGALDTNGNGLWDVGEDWLLQARAPLDGGTTLRGNNVNVRRAIGFNPRGFSGSAGTLRLCDSRGPQDARGVIISNTGRSRRAVDSNGDGIVEDGGGNNLPCP